MAITKITTPELFDFSATNTALQLPTGTTAQRPGTLAGTANPVAGEWRYNTTLKYVEFYDGANWFRIDTEAIPAPNPVGNESFNVSTYFGNGGTQTLDAKFNEAANFNGGTSKIDLPNSSALSKANDFSWSFWINASSFGSDNTILRLTSNYYTYVTVYTNRLMFYSGPTQHLTPAGSVVTGVWQNFVITKSSTAGVVVYKNGTSIYTDPGTADANATSAVNRIGAWDGSAYGFPGQIDQVRVFNSAITAAEAEDLYTDETTTTAATLNFPVGAGCIAAYQLDGNGNDISTNYNSTSTTDIGYTGLKFKPDFVWIKQKSGGASHSLQNTILGVGADYTLYTDDSVAMGDYNVYGYLSGFDANGFTVVNQNGNHTNAASSPYVAWSWKAGGAPDAINGNTPGTPPTLGSVMIDGVKSTADLNGSIAAKKISANTDAGFSIVEHLGSGANATVAHGLSSILELIIYKQYTDVGSGKNWVVYAKPLGETQNIILNLTSNGGTDPDSWNNTAPTDTVFSLGPGSNSYGSQTNVSGKLNIAYCFHSVPGYSKIDFYNGSGQNAGPTIPTGFKPAWIIIKCTNYTSGTDWVIFDNKRPGYYLYANASTAQGNASSLQINFTSTGFNTVGIDGTHSAAGYKYIYMAFAE